MAATHSKAPVGSAQWLVSERQQAGQLVQEEVEEFSYSVRNEMEWLNEHMAEIFTRGQLNVTDVFKTPGNLRGKTPRTARRNPLENRAPLTDLFAPNPQAELDPSQKTDFYNKVAQFQVAGDHSNAGPLAPGSPTKQLIGVGKANADSGYHGSTEDEMDVDQASLAARASPKKMSPGKIVSDNRSVSPERDHNTAEERRTTGGSFVSAREASVSKEPTKEDLLDDYEAADPDEDTDIIHVMMSEPQEAMHMQENITALSPQLEVVTDTTSAVDQIHTEVTSLPNETDVDDEARSPSEGSSPVKPLVRKSSLTFASLPAREPLTTKKSMGARVSRISHLDQSKTQIASQSSHMGRFTGGKSLGESQHTALPDNEGDEVNTGVNKEVRPEPTREESETTKLHNKTSTQRLHERINMLGQSKESRPSKSIPSLNPTSQASYPQLPTHEPEKFNPLEAASKPPMKDHATRSATQNLTDDDDDDDDWIAPIVSVVPQTAAIRPQLTKSHSTDVMEQINGKESVGGLEVGLQYPGAGSPARANSVRTASPAKEAVGPASLIPTSFASPTRAATILEQIPKMAISKSNPNLTLATGFTPSASSPSGKRYVDGPLSASKAKFYSVLKSAKGMFASSAGASAQAKMEALSPPSTRLRNQVPAPSIDGTLAAKPGVLASSALYPDIKQAIQEATQTSNSVEPKKSAEGRRTRSSSEREKRKEKEAQEQQRAVDEIEKAHGTGRQEAAAHRVEKLQTTAQEHEQVALARLAASSRAETQATEDFDADSADEMPPPPPPKSLLPTAQTQKPKETRRLQKPVKDALPKAKPAPVSIRVASQRVCTPEARAGFLAGTRVQIGQAQPSTAALSASLHDSLPPLPPPKQQAASSKMSNVSSNTTSTQASFKSSVNAQSARLKALEAAAKKKEQASLSHNHATPSALTDYHQEEKAAQRKAEQKRELEQKRAAKLEEDRRLEQQRKADEQLRLQEARKTAQKQAAEAKKLEQQRKEAASAQSKQAVDLATALQQEKAHAPPPPPRGDLGAAKPLSKMNTVQESSRPVAHPINPAKPPKRNRADGDEEPAQRPAYSRSGPSYQQLDSKRRKTNENDVEDGEPRRSVMAPPIRHSNIRKEPSKFPHGYMVAPPAATHAPSIFKATVTAQHHLQHSKVVGHPNDMAKFSSAKIPFAEAPNPPAGPSTSNAPTKTPLRAPGAAAKSSPHYPPGENIALPEIATDSEDEGSETEFSAPSWVNSPALRELLAQQQLVDPEHVFGPIAPLQMEEVFKNKDRHKRFRDRTSSANWSGADRLTEEERRRDREGRERLMREGGWTFNGAV